MNIKDKKIVEAAAQIIVETGLNGLTLSGIADRQDLPPGQLYQQISDDDDLLLMLLLGFETDLHKTLKTMDNTIAAPESALKLLFKKIYHLFQLKPYYLSIVFDKNMAQRDESIRKSMRRIQKYAEKSLTQIIDAGKQQYIFKTKVPTHQLVSQILSSFRLLMKDEQRVNEMMLELKTYRKLND